MVLLCFYLFKVKSAKEGKLFIHTHAADDKIQAFVIFLKRSHGVEAKLQYSPCMKPIV